MTLIALDALVTVILTWVSIGLILGAPTAVKSFNEMWVLVTYFGFPVGVHTQARHCTSSFRHW